MKELGTFLMVIGGIFTSAMGLAMLASWIDTLSGETKGWIVIGTPPTIFIIGLILWFV